MLSMAFVIFFSLSYSIFGKLLPKERLHGQFFRPLKVAHHIRKAMFNEFLFSVHYGRLGHLKRCFSSTDVVGVLYVEADGMKSADFCGRSGS